MIRKFTTNTLVVATHNRGKLVELNELLSPYVKHLKCAADYQLAAPEETGLTFRENALIKAKYVAERTDLPALADDSGLSIPLLGGKPGIHSADWMLGPKGAEGAFEMIKEMIQAVPFREPIEASFHVAMVLYWPDGRYEIAEASCPGYISYPPRGKNGHGYDPIFVPRGSQKTFAEMTLGEKQQFSHRGKALRALIKMCFDPDSSYQVPDDRDYNELPKKSSDDEDSYERDDRHWDEDHPDDGDE